MIVWWLREKLLESGVLVTLRDELHRLKLRSVLRRHNLTWNGSPISKKVFWTKRERRLTSRHSFLDANLLARSESVSVANPLDGHRNCLT